MTLSSYISDLLYRYECVIIPDFGAFLTQHVPAKVHETTQAFYPPRKVISFNKQLQSNDGLLADYIAKSEGIYYDEALKKIKAFTSYINNQLELEGHVSIANVGELALDANQKLQFEPYNKVNYLLDSFGLAPFVSPIIKRETYIEQAASLEKNSTLQLSTAHNVSRLYFKYAAVGIMAFALSGLGALGWYGNEVKAHNFTKKQKANSLVENRIQEATFIISNPLPSVTFEMAMTSGNYHIIAGAFRIKENALRKVSQLKKLGYEARNIGANKYGLHQVVYSSHDDRISAIKQLRLVQKEENEDAWMLVKNLN